MSCTLFAFMGFSFLIPLLCACLSLICSTFATQQKKRGAREQSWVNRNIQLTEKRYAAMMVLMQAKKFKTIEQPPIPQTIKALPRFIFLTYPWHWIKRMYRSKHFRQFLVICMACLLAVSVFLTIFLAYDNAQLRRYCLSHICAKRSMI